MNTFRTEILIVLLSLLLLCAPRDGLAQGDTAAAVSEADASLARKYLDEGVEAYQSNDFETARDKFRRSFNLKRSYDTAINLGNVEEKLKFYRDAAEHLDYGLRHYPTAQNQDRKKAIERIFERVRPHVGAVSVAVDVPGASLFIDDRPVGTSPLSYEIFVEEGPHRVRANFEGKSVATEFEATNGETSQVDLKLEDRSPAPASGLDHGDPTFGEAPPGEPARRKRNWVPAYILGGTTVAAFGTSMVFKGLMAGKRNDVEDLRSRIPEGACAGEKDSDCNELSAGVEAHNTYRTISNVSLIVSGGAAAATAGYVIFTLLRKDRPKRGGLNASGWVDASGGQLLLHGSF